MREWELSLVPSHGTEALLGSPAVMLAREPAEGKETSPSEVWELSMGAESFLVSKEC